MARCKKTEQQKVDESMIRDRVKELRRVKASVLMDNPKNWRKHPGKQRDAMDSVLKKIGFAGAVLARETEDGLVLIDGHLRKGMVDPDMMMPVLVLDVNENEADTIMATYDPIGALAKTDEDALNKLISSTADLLGEVDTKSLLGGLSSLAKELGTEVVEPEIPDPPKKPVTKLGDVWQLGEHRLVCGAVEDVAEQAFVEPWWLMVTDPPYGVSYASKNEFLNKYDKGNRNQDEIKGDGCSEEEMFEFWKTTFSCVRKHGLPGASYYVTGPQGGDLLLLLLLALKDSDFLLKHMLIWAKNNHVLGRSDYNYKHEPIVYGWLKGAAHHKVTTPGETSLWEIDRPAISKLHPTMKPVELYARAYRNSSNPGDVMAEPFAGFGTAYVAGEQMGRCVEGCELEAKYCDVIVERWQGISGKKAKRLKKG